jgi:hypothetical protein
MLHACLYTICFVFCYTSWRFYAFSRTNLLTRRHSASSLFLLFLCFRKATQDIFSELYETKAKVPIFPEASQSPKQRQRGCQRAAAPCHGAGHPLAALGCGVGPWSTSWRCPSAYIFPSTGKPKEPDKFSTKPTASRRRHRREIGRVQKLFPAPCQRGESPPEAFFITMPASGVMCE